MSNTLIIYSHPNKTGNSGYYLEQVKKNLDSQNKDYEVLDLYKMKFDPLLYNEELYTIGNNKVTEENIEIQNKIKTSENLIFIYPTWWQNVPAILKGFFDRILVGGFAFRFKGKIPVGLLKDKRALIFTTSGGPRFSSKFIAGDLSIKVVTKSTLNFCGIKTKAFSVGDANTLTDKTKVKIETVVKKGLKFLN